MKTSLQVRSTNKQQLWINTVCGRASCLHICTNIFSPFTYRLVFLYMACFTYKVCNISTKAYSLDSQSTYDHLRGTLRIYLYIRLSYTLTWILSSIEAVSEDYQDCRCSSCLHMYENKRGYSKTNEFDRLSNKYAVISATYRKKYLRKSYL